MAGDAAHEHFPTPYDIGPALHAARLTLSNLFPEVQKLQFSENLSSTEVILLEASEELISQIEDGTKFLIRGRRDDFAVLCSQDRTWEIKERETSNTLLMAPDVLTARCLSLDGQSAVTTKEIPSVTSEYFELRPIIPRWGLAKHLLEEAPFSGYVNESSIQEKRKYKFSELLDVVQSSEEELLCYLQEKISACEINGFWRLLETQYIWTLIEKVMAWIDENDLDRDNIPLYEACNALLDTEPEEVLQKYFWERFAERSGETFRIREDAVKRHFARHILTKISTITIPAVNEQFLRAMGSGFSLKDVDGIAFQMLDDKMNLTETIAFFPKDDLQIEPEARFRALFDAKSRWTKEEIVPFICDILLPGQTVEQLLLKHSKSYTSRPKAKKRNQGTEEIQPITYFIPLH